GDSGGLRLVLQRLARAVTLRADRRLRVVRERRGADGEPFRLSELQAVRSRPADQIRLHAAGATVLRADRDRSAHHAALDVRHLRSVGAAPVGRAPPAARGARRAGGRRVGGRMPGERRLEYLRAIGIDLWVRRGRGARGANVYSADVLTRRPTANRDPKPKEVAACLPYLVQQIALLQPTIKLALGRIAAQNMLGTDVPLGRLPRRVHHFGELTPPLAVT